MSSLVLRPSECFVPLKRIQFIRRDRRKCAERGAGSERGGRRAGDDDDGRKRGMRASRARGRVDDAGAGGLIRLGKEEAMVAD